MPALPLRQLHPSAPFHFQQVRLAPLFHKSVYRTHVLLKMKTQRRPDVSVADEMRVGSSETKRSLQTVMNRSFVHDLKAQVALTEMKWTTLARLTADVQVSRMQRRAKDD